MNLLTRTGSERRNKTAEELAAAIEAATGTPFKRVGRQFAGRCVAHDDHDPSMLIFDGRDEVQVRCMAGCTPGEIIDVLKDRGLWGYDLGNARPPIKPAHQERDRADIARWLWSQRLPIAGTPAERYLRDVRGIGCALPPTLGYLPARGEHGHAMIGAFGMTLETEPGVLVIPHGNVVAVHLTKLTSAGDKIEKIMVGSPRGAPIVLSPINDLLGLAITEGVEDGLSMVEATGLGVWAAGAATLMPSLADAVPVWTDCVTVLTDLADANGAGLRYSSSLIEELCRRGIHAEAMASHGGAFA